MSTGNFHYLFVIFKSLDLFLNSSALLLICFFKINQSIYIYIAKICIIFFFRIIIWPNCLPIHHRSDPVWLRQLQAHLASAGHEGIYGRTRNKYSDWSELLFSLRSVFVNAPWIRTIHLVTADQVSCSIKQFYLFLCAGRMQ
jgi:hypothetical protein